MKKLAVILAAILLLICFAGCDRIPGANTSPESTEPEKLFITSEEVDLRQMVVDYMYAMANIKWTAGPLLDYSSQGSPSLIYEPGKTYLGMVYNNNRTGLEVFQSILDENNQYIGTVTSWNASPGNSCATSIEHAWQLVSPTVEFEYSVDMLPYYEKTGVVAVGNIDWSCYNGSNTNSVINNNKRDDILEAYAAVLPGDAFVRYLDTGGHALMVTKEPTIVRNNDGTINMANSYIYLTDQNNRLHNRREYPSSWQVDNPVSFASALQDGYLPVTTAELRDGIAPVPTFEVSGMPTAEDLASGTVKGSVKSNYCINTVRMELVSGGKVVASSTDHPYTRNCGFKDLGKELNITALPSGKYTLTIVAEVGLGSKTIVEVTFSK